MLIDKDKIRKELNTLSDVAKQATLDALRAIILSRNPDKSAATEVKTTSPLHSPRSAAKDNDADDSANNQNKGSGSGNASNQDKNSNSNTGNQGKGGDSESASSSNKGSGSRSANASGQDKNSNTNNTGNQNKGSDSKSASSSNKNSSPSGSGNASSSNKNSNSNTGQDNKPAKKTIEARRIQQAAEEASKKAAARNDKDLQNKIDEIKNKISSRSNDEIEQKMSDEELNDLSDKLTELSGNLTGVEKIDRDDAKARQNKINQELNKDDFDTLRTLRQEKQARDNIKKYKAKPTCGTRQRFSHEIFSCIKSQITMVLRQVPSYLALSKRQLAGIDVIEPGVVSEYIKEKDIPSIDVYYDQSGSWDESAIAAGNNAISCLNYFVKKKLCKINIYYFAEHIGTVNDETVIGQGTYAWPEIMHNIEVKKPQNVIIMTDSDRKDLAGKESYRVKGAVWWIWRSKEVACPELMEDLYGSVNKQFVLQY